MLSIDNCGLGVLTWQVTESCSWLSLDPNSGVSDIEIDDVTVSVDISGLECVGEYVAYIEVTAPIAANNPLLIPVHLEVSYPIICTSSTTLDLLATEGDTSPVEIPLSISNCGIGTLEWEIVEAVVRGSVSIPPLAVRRARPMLSP